MLKIFIIFFVLFFKGLKLCPLDYIPQILNEEIITDRILQSSTSQPIRILFDYSGLLTLNSEKLSYLKIVLNDIGVYLSSLIQVIFYIL